MVFIQNNWVLSTDNFYIKKINRPDKKFSINIMEHNSNKEYIIAIFDEEKYQI